MEHGSQSPTYMLFSLHYLHLALDSSPPRSLRTGNKEGRRVTHQQARMPSVSNRVAQVPGGVSLTQPLRL